VPVDINGYILSEASGLKLGASNSKIMAANYGIVDPMLPGMLGSATGSGGTYKIHPFPVNDVNLNIGSCWNASTYRFTAPVAGIYYTSYSGIVGNGTNATTAGYFGVCVNGGLWYFSYKDTNPVWELHHIEMMLRLAAGDYVTWAFNISPAPDTGSNAGAYQANHNTCTIWLVG
jgi:C1q domain